MALSAQNLSKPMSMVTTNSCLVSVQSLFTLSKPSTLQTIHFKFKPSNKLSLRCIYSSNSSLSLFLPKKKDSVFIISAQQEENPVLVEEEEQIDGNLNWDVGSESEETGGFSEPSEEAKVYVGNLPYDVDSEKLAMVFGEAGIVEISEVIFNRETGQSRGFGFVTMSTVEEAEKAVEKFSGYELNGRQLTVNKAAPRGSRPERTERGPRVFESASRIYVGNLPWTLDDEGLEQVFSEYGKVVSARVISDRETGRSRGFGFVVMSSESEMTDAITNLDGQSLDGRAIRVNVAEEKPRRSRF